MELLHQHPAQIYRSDALLCDIRNGIRALCRRWGAGWDGPDLAPLNDDLLSDLTDLASIRADEREELAEELARMRGERE